MQILKKTVSLKTYVATLAIITFLVFSTFSYVLSQSGTVTVEPSSFVETASYVIFKDGSTYKAKNGETAEIDYSGTNASQLVENVESVSSVGDTIFFNVGTYTFTTNVTVDIQGITIDGAKGAIIESNGFVFSASDTVVHNIKFQNSSIGVRLLGTYPGSLYLRQKVLQCEFYYCTKGISAEYVGEFQFRLNTFYGNTYGIYIENFGSDSVIDGNSFGYGTDSQAGAIWVAYGATHITEGIKIINNYILHKGYGVYIDRGNAIWIERNTIATFDDGIFIEDGYSSQIWVEGNTIDGILGVSEAYGISVGTVEWLWICENIIYDSYAHGIGFRVSAGVSAFNVWINNNKFSGNSRGNNNTYADIWLDSVTNAKIVGNHFNNETDTGGTHVTYNIYEESNRYIPTGFATQNHFGMQVYTLGTINYYDNEGYP